MVGQLFQMARDLLDARLHQKIQAGFEAMNQGSGAGARFPGECAPVPALFEVQVVIRIWNTHPADERRLNTLARAIGKIQVTNAFRSQQPLVTGSGGHVNELCLNVDRNNTERLNCVHDEQRVVLPRESAQPFEIRCESPRRTGRD